MIRFFNKCLHYIRHALQCLVTQDPGTYRHFAVSQKLQPLLLHNDLKHFLCLVAFQFILGEEQHGNSVFPFSSNRNPLFFAGFFKEFVRNLKQNTDAVTGLSLCVLSCPVLQVFHNLQCIFHGFVALNAFAVHYGSDTAVVVFKLLPIQSFIFSHSQIPLLSYIQQPHTQVPQKGDAHDSVWILIRGVPVFR